MIDTVKKAIHGRYTNNDQIKMRRGAWVIDKDIRIDTSEYNSFGFSLDNETNRPFAFLKNSPPKHIAKMCDAIIIFGDGDTLYIALIEQKTGDSEGNDKQLANGKFFCEWMVSLCKKHDYYDYKSIKYFGLLVWEPTDHPLRGETTYRPPEAQSSALFDKFFDLANVHRIYLKDLVEAQSP